MGHRHPNAIKNLKRFPRGVSGNPSGSVRKGDKWTAPQWLADWKGREITCADLEAIVKNRKTEHPYKVAAAVQALNGAKTGERWVLDKDGTLKVGTIDPEPGRERERLSDRMVGKVRQEIQVTRINQPSLADLRQAALETARLLGPVVVNRMIERMQEKTAKDHSIVNTTAEEVLTAAKNTAAATVAPADEGDWSQEGFNRAARAAIESLREPDDPDAEALSKALGSV